MVHLPVFRRALSTKLPDMKPYVICHMVTSVDGRIWGSRWRPKANVVSVERNIEAADRNLGAVDEFKGIAESRGKQHSPGLQSDDDEVIESLISLDDFVGHAFGGPLHVICSHDPGAGNKNAPIWGRKASFAFSHVRGPSCPSGPHGTRLTIRRRLYRVLANRACYR